MGRLPTPGSDKGTWGEILNDFLLTAHNSDGSLKQASDIAIAKQKAEAAAPNSTVVHISGDESVAGVKTFSAAPIVPSGAFPQTAIVNLTSDLGGKLSASSNLSDLASASTARTNLGLGAAATMSPAQLASNSAFTNVFGGVKTVNNITPDGSGNIMVSGTAMYGQVSTLAALRALSVVSTTPMLVTTTGATYTYSASVNANTRDDGNEYIVPNAGGGVWVRQGPAPSVTPFPRALERIAKANTGTFTILQCGTSIGNSDYSPNKVFCEQLRSVYGDTKSWVYFAGVLGGSYDAPYLGWKKQPYGGLSFYRARGDSGSSDMALGGYGDTITIEYSKESDGVSTTVFVDGTQVGTIDCSGTQSYGNKATFVAPSGLAMHTVVITKPASGYVYFERLIVSDSTQTGVEIIDATLGGSSLANTKYVRTASGQQVAPVAIQGNNGIGAYFARTDVDLVICTWIVNDAGAGQTGWADTGPTNGFTDAIDTAIAMTKAANIPLLYIVEMAGSYADPNNPPYLWMYWHYKAIREYILKVARENNHVGVVDWHGATILSDLDAYRTRYYSATGSSGAYVGDFIHPNEAGNRVGVTMVCQTVGIDPPKYATGTDLSLRRSLKPFNTDAPVRVTTRGTAQYIPSAGLSAIKMAGPAVHGRTVQLYFDEKAINQDSNFNNTIIANGSADRFGTAYTFPANTNVYCLPFFNFPAGRRLQLVFKVAGVVGISAGNGATFYYGGVAIGTGIATTGYTSSVSEPYYITVEMGGANSNPYFSVTGKFYEFHAVESTVPTLTLNTNVGTTYPGLNGPVSLVGDPVYNATYRGQTYFEDQPDSSMVHKRLVGACRKWDSTGQTYYWAGLYESLDRSAPVFRIGRMNAAGGTLSLAPATSLLGGGSADRTTSGNKYISISSVAINVTRKYTVTFRSINPSGYNPMVYFFNGGNNQYRFLTPTGTWSSTSTGALGAGLDFAETCSVTFDAPTSEVGQMGNTPEFRVSGLGGSDFAPVTLSYGSSGMV